MWAVAVGWVWLKRGCDLSDICSDTCRIHPIKVADIRYPTDISHIIFGSDIRSDYPYPYPLSEKKIRKSENSIRISIHHLRIRIRTDIFRTILHPYSPSCCRPGVSNGPGYRLALGPRAGCRRGDHCFAFVMSGAAGAKDSEDWAYVFAGFRIHIHSARSLFVYYLFL
jgi:hypothetical protein